MKRMRYLPLLLALVCAAAATGTAFTIGVVTGSDRPTRDELARPCLDGGIDLAPCDLLPEEGAPVQVARSQRDPTPTNERVVCPDILFKVGLRVAIPCGHGAEIVKTDFAEIDGRYCAEVAYIPETRSPPRTETLCRDVSTSSDVDGSTHLPPRVGRDTGAHARPLASGPRLGLRGAAIRTDQMSLTGG
jgi:hypothetical protein